MRPIEDVFRVLEWAKAQGAVKAAVDDVMVEWGADGLLGFGGMGGGEASDAGNVLVGAQGGTKRFTRSRGEGAALADIARKRSEDEKGLGLPEFRDPEDILAAEEAAEKGETVPPAGATEGEE